MQGDHLADRGHKLCASQPTGQRRAQRMRRKCTQAQTPKPTHSHPKVTGVGAPPSGNAKLSATSQPSLLLRSA